MSVTLALSTLCENPCRRTGLTTLFHEFVTHALRLFPDVNWIVFVGPEAPWNVRDARVTVVRDFPANDRRGARLWADHFLVGPAARARGAAALLTVGFAPVRSAGLPVAMHVFRCIICAGARTSARGELREARVRGELRDAWAWDEWTGV